jgi:hypothetical protein
MTTNATTIQAQTSDRNPTVEAWIESFGVTDWDFQIVQLSDIDDAKSSSNQARFKPIDDLTVNHYGLAASAGAKFPPLVLARAGKALVTIDGNHRRKGLPLGGIHEHPAYIIDAANDVRELMTASANTTNGLSFTDAERRRTALFLSSKGMAADQVAVLTGLSPDQVKATVAADNGRQRAKDRRAAAKVSDSQMRNIGRAVSDEVLDFLVANQAGAKSLPDKVLTSAVTQSNKQRSDAARLRVVHDVIAAHKGEAAKPTRTTQDAAKLTRALGGILNCNPTAVAIASQDRQTLIDKIDAAVDALAEIQAALR